MKRFLIILLALAFVCGAFGCGKKAPADPKNTSAPTKEPSFENVVEFEEGVLVGGSFNWRYFIAKVGAGMNAEIELVDKKGGEEIRRKLSFDRTSYTLLEGKDAVRYTRLVREIVELPTGPARVAFLTNDPEADLAKLMGGAVSELPLFGPLGDSGFLVYVNAAPSADELEERTGG